MERGVHRTDIESIMFSALKEENIETVPEFPIRCKYGYRVDFAIPDLKLIIECDGEAWHKLGNDRDRKRDGYLRSRGWTLLRFRGNEIKTNIKNCIEQIKEMIFVQNVVMSSVV